MIEARVKFCGGRLALSCVEPIMEQMNMGV
jgi:hypothetical protein